jgi:hypothetical protein
MASTAPQDGAKRFPVRFSGRLATGAFLDGLIFSNATEGPSYAPILADEIRARRIFDR